MTPTATLRAIHNLGGHVWIKAGGLAYSMRDSGVGRELIDALRENKTEILVLLGPVSRWPETLRELFEERAAIMEFDGGLARWEADRTAEKQLREGFTTGSGE